MKTILAVAVVLGCATDPKHDLHDRLTDCPSWPHVEFCEAACEPQVSGASGICLRASNPTTSETMMCGSTFVVDGTRGCCVQIGDPLQVLYFECPAQ